MSKAYSVSKEKATPELKAEQARRKEAVERLNSMKELRVRRLVARAERSEKVVTKDGVVRTYRVGSNVAAMVGRLLYYEGKSELGGGWVYKSAAEIEEETGLTERKQRSARRVAREEGIWEEKRHWRRDGREVVAYRLDVWRLWEIVNGAQIAAAAEALGRARDPIRKAELRTQLADLEKTGATLALGDGHEAGGGDGLAHQGVRGNYSTPDIMSGDPLHNVRTTREYNKGLPLTGDPSRGAGSVAPAGPTPPAHPLSPDEQDEAPLGDKLFRQVEAIVRADCQSERAREAVAPLVERYVTGDAHAPSVCGVAKVVRGFVRMQPGEEGDVPGLVEEVLEEMRAEAGCTAQRKEEA